MWESCRGHCTTLKLCSAPAHLYKWYVIIAFRCCCMTGFNINTVWPLYLCKLLMIVSAHLQVTELWQFFLLRMLTGVAVGGCFPLVFSLLADLFPSSRRAAMSALVQIAAGLGIGAGQVGGFGAMWLGSVISSRRSLVVCCCIACVGVVVRTCVFCVGGPLSLKQEGGNECIGLYCHGAGHLGWAGEWVWCGAAACSRQSAMP